MLQNLPPELVSQIVSSAVNADILSLRLACRTLYEKTFSAFATAFFHRVVVDLCPKPLERLRQIANHERLRLYVRELAIFGVRSCPNPPRHMPGTGHRWARDPSSGCLDPSFPIISDLRAVVSRLVNCRFVAVLDDQEPNAELRGPSEEGGLLLLDTVHVALLLANNLQALQTFRVSPSEFPNARILTQSNPTDTDRRSLLPRSVAGSLSESWATNLVDLHLQWYSRHDADSLLVLVDLVLGARSLQKLCMGGAPGEFYRRLAAAAPPDALPLAVLEVREATRDMTSDVLIALATRFRRTLAHLYVRHVRLGDPENWAAVLRSWARDLGRLESFGLQYLLGRAAAGTARKPLLLGPVLEWQGMPTSGVLQFTAQRVSPARSEIDGVHYNNRGRVEDVQSVLRELAQCCSSAPASDSPTTGLDNTTHEYRTAGGLVAQKVLFFHIPELRL
ncbi:predicted protein [Chaetomium globosum CBS 148.51]|uniref:F-box domain-containing protein n=1 Tax=Chaetomium globosum (strain ATCC 6205 / CBS 148.51 / DSM 1962 / NBRC 6347 / NRRL 1970) TaxID=306901 RepID=Q2H8P6_CHAGB|nr:uncharacterized protein CHGG_03408 [Chaetomium globosum CBS 148.51]EAQ91473.1 predicted protein [Chaetomium globosum CBS 148.51]